MENRITFPMAWLTRNEVDKKITHVFTNVVDLTGSVSSHAEGITLEYEGNPYNLIFTGAQKELTEDQVK